jgi:hypothetical protein
MNVATRATTFSTARRSSVAIRTQRATSKSHNDDTEVRLFGNRGTLNDDNENPLAHCENPDGVKDAHAAPSMASNTHNSQGRYAHAK